MQRSPLRRKRVVWCPKGLLAMLPLHAAGIYSGPIKYRDNIFNYAVSSYTPTTTAFCRAMKSSSRVTMQTPRSMLVIADQAQLGTHEQLPNVAAEADIIKRLVPLEFTMDFTDIVPISSGNFSSTNVSHVELLHFACHGKQDKSNPLNSGLELSDGPLTLNQLTNVIFPNGRLAYLSACETASVDSVCPDSGMNLATTFLFNGFRSVIGSMWQVTCLHHNLTLINISQVYAGH
jgi:CHAT domain-containing protein